MAASEIFDLGLPRIRGRVPRKLLEVHHPRGRCGFVLHACRLTVSSVTDMSVSRIVTRIESPSPECGRSAAARSRQATRGRLPASGVSRFAERGLNAVTSHDVTSHDAAREAGVATGIFYLHLPDGTHPD